MDEGRWMLRVLLGFVNTSWRCTGGAVPSRAVSMLPNGCMTGGACFHLRYVSSIGRDSSRAQGGASKERFVIHVDLESRQGEELSKNLSFSLRQRALKDERRNFPSFDSECREPIEGTLRGKPAHLENINLGRFSSAIRHLVARNTSTLPSATPFHSKRKMRECLIKAAQRLPQQFSEASRLAAVDLCHGALKKLLLYQIADKRRFPPQSDTRYPFLHVFLDEAIRVEEVNAEDLRRRGTDGCIRSSRRRMQWRQFEATLLKHHSKFFGKPEVPGGPAMLGSSVLVPGVPLQSRAFVIILRQILFDAVPKFQLGDVRSLLEFFLQTQLSTLSNANSRDRTNVKLLFSFSFLEELLEAAARCSRRFSKTAIARQESFQKGLDVKLINEALQSTTSVLALAFKVEETCKHLLQATAKEQSGRGAANADVKAGDVSDEPVETDDCIYRITHLTNCVLDAVVDFVEVLREIPKQKAGSVSCGAATDSFFTDPSLQRTRAASAESGLLGESSRIACSGETAPQSVSVVSRNKASWLFASPGRQSTLVSEDAEEINQLLSLSTRRAQSLLCACEVLKADCGFDKQQSASSATKLETVLRAVQLNERLRKALLPDARLPDISQHAVDFVLETAEAPSDADAEDVAEKEVDRRLECKVSSPQFLRRETLQTLTSHRTILKRCVSERKPTVSATSDHDASEYGGLRIRKSWRRAFQILRKCWKLGDLLCAIEQKSESSRRILPSNTHQHLLRLLHQRSHHCALAEAISLPLPRLLMTVANTAKQIKDREFQFDAVALEANAASAPAAACSVDGFAKAADSGLKKRLLLLELEALLLKLRSSTAEHSAMRRCGFTEWTICSAARCLTALVDLNRKPLALLEKCMLEQIDWKRRAQGESKENEETAGLFEKKTEEATWCVPPLVLIFVVHELMLYTAPHRFKCLRLCDYVRLFSALTLLAPLLMHFCPFLASQSRNRNRRKEQPPPSQALQHLLSGLGQTAVLLLRSSARDCGFESLGALPLGSQASLLSSIRRLRRAEKFLWPRPVETRSQGAALRC